MNPIARLLSSRRREKLVVVTRDVSVVRMEEWRSEPSLTKLASKFFSDPDFKMMIDVLRNEHLLNYVLPLDTPLDQRAILQARAEGYGTCLANLQSLANLSHPQEPVEATYEAPETEIPTDKI